MGTRQRQHPAQRGWAAGQPELRPTEHGHSRALLSHGCRRMLLERLPRGRQTTRSAGGQDGDEVGAHPPRAAQGTRLGLHAEMAPLQLCQILTGPERNSGLEEQRRGPDTSVPCRHALPRRNLIPVKKHMK